MEIDTERKITHISYGNVNNTLSLVKKLIELQDYYGGGPPSCTEIYTKDEKYFDEIILPKATINFLHDIATNFGYKITSLEKIKDLPEDYNSIPLEPIKSIHVTYKYIGKMEPMPYDEE